MNSSRINLVVMLTVMLSLASFGVVKARFTGLHQSNQWHRPAYGLANSQYSNSWKQVRRGRYYASSQSQRPSTILAARRQTKPADETSRNRSPTRKRRMLSEEPDEPQVPDISFDDLGPIGKTVAGVTEIAVSTILGYFSGFFPAFFLGTAVGVPGLLFRPMQRGVPQLFLTEAKQRIGRMNTRSMTWGKSWGGISAAFGCFDVTIKVLRKGQEDEWNQILSSAAAGAYFSRAGGPTEMIKGALLYGGFIYLLSGGFGRKRPLNQYTEQPIEF